MKFVIILLAAQAALDWLLASLALLGGLDTAAIWLGVLGGVSWLGAEAVEFFEVLRSRRRSQRR